MQFVAHYEVESELSVISDDLRLKLQHPNGKFQARINNIVRNDYSRPFLLSVQIAFAAPSLKEAPDIAQDRLAEFLNILAFVTSAGVRRHRIRQIVGHDDLSALCSTEMIGLPPYSLRPYSSADAFKVLNGRQFGLSNVWMIATHLNHD